MKLTRKQRDEAFRDVAENPPERLRRTMRTRGHEQYQKQLTAIALDKARQKARDTSA